MKFIDTIEIKNFKSIRRQKIEGCKRVNVFIGYPNVGKSNIIEALGLFSVAQLANGEKFSLNQICRLNHLSDLFFDKNLKNELFISINNDLTLFFSKRLPTAEFEIRVDSKSRGPGFIVAVANNLEFQTFPLESNKLKDTEAFRIKYYLFEKNVEINKSKSLALSIPNGDNLFEILRGDSELTKDCAELFSEYNLKLVLDEEGRNILVQKQLDEYSVVQFSYSQIADTLRRLIFNKSAIATNKDAIILFEEPEAHMFPPYIRKFTSDVIFDKTNQFFIATHSPYVIEEFIEEIKDDLSIYVVDYDKGETIVKRLTDEDVTEIAQYGIDLFFNLESYLDKYGQPRSA